MTIASAASVMAAFSLNTYVLSVARSGTGSGTVTSIPSGVNCGGTCIAAYDAGTTVTLTATAGGTSAMTGWSGACTGLGACMVTMNAARSVLANFDTDVRSVTVMRAGTGTGTVTSIPAGINCGATCVAFFAQGSTITLVASPAPGSSFVGWSGACTGASSCAIVLSSSATATALFQ